MNKSTLQTNRSILWFMSWLLVLAVVVPSAPTALAAETPASSPTTQPAGPPPLASPRDTVKTFFAAMQDKKTDQAAACLDLSDIEKDQRSQKGEELARLLEKTITRLLPQVEMEIIPDDPNHKNDKNKPIFTLTTTDKDKNGKTYNITLQQGKDKFWRFSGQTLADLPKIYESIDKTPTTQPAVAAGVPKNLSTAQETFKTFRQAMKEAKDNPERFDDAIKCLDLSKLPTTIKTDRTRLNILVEQLQDILHRTGKILEQQIPNRPDGDPFDLREDKEGSVIIRKAEDGRWLFSAETVENIQKLYETLLETEELKEGTGELVSWELWLAARIPKSLKKDWLGLEYWQWMGISLLILVGVIIDLIIRMVFGTILNSILRRRKVEIEIRTKGSAARPFGLILMGLLWWHGLPFLLLPHLVDAVLLFAAKSITSVAGVWAIYKLIDLVSDYFQAKAARTDTKFDDLLVPMIRKTLKIIATLVAFVFLAGIFDWKLTGILAGLGIGGLAIGFAARETLQNFFGSITVLLDRPFHIGDWIKIGDVEGTVENVGFRTTRIRTFYNSLITVPNMLLTTQMIDNLGARRYRRIKAMISLTYDTPPEKIDAFCEGIRELIRQHPYTRKDYYHVYFNQFADSSLNILLYCFHETPDWATELRERHRLFNDIIRLAQKLGVEFAFPTQTIHLQQESATAKTTPPDLAPDPQAVGRKTAITLIKEAGLAHKTPPPVNFSPPTPHGGEDADE
ncbi:MAG: mechanosensitive ion channel family protein [Planctomycetota bacterium]